MTRIIISNLKLLQSNLVLWRAQVSSSSTGRSPIQSATQHPFVQVAEASMYHRIHFLHLFCKSRAMRFPATSAAISSPNSAWGDLTMKPLLVSKRCRPAHIILYQLVVITDVPYLEISAADILRWAPSPLPILGSTT